MAARDTIFLHGNLASHRWWHPTVDAWRAGGSLGSGRLMLVDWRGCGNSPDLDPSEPASIDAFAGDVVDFIQRETIGPVDLVGHSLGGLFAARVASLAPNRVRRMCLLDPVGPRGVTFDDSMYEAFDQMAKDSALTKAIILSTIRNAERLPEAYQSALAHDAQRAVAGAGRAALAILRDVDLSKALKHVQTPTLVLHGREDQVIAPSDGEALARSLPNATFEVIADAGHCWNVEDAPAFTARLRDWLG